jgi:hypothetical protein
MLTLAFIRPGRFNTITGGNFGPVLAVVSNVCFGKQRWQPSQANLRFEPESNHSPVVIFSAIYLHFRPGAVLEIISSDWIYLAALPALSDLQVVK